jgi:phage tail tape-measure protein
MKSDGRRRPAASIVDDGALEGLKKRARDLGLIVNAGRKAGSTELQTKTARELDPKAERAAERKTVGKKKGGKR